MRAMNCPRCGKLFNKILVPVCPKCEKLEEEQFQELRKYIYEEPLATITEVSEATGVPTKRILRYIREGRLEVPKSMMDEMRCVSCGRPIEEGNFCDSCSKNLIEQFTDEYTAKRPKHIPPPAKKDAPKKGIVMHTRK